MTTPPPQTIDEIVKKFETVIHDCLNRGVPEDIVKHFRTALTSAIQGDRERIIKIVEEEYSRSKNFALGELLQILTPKE